MPVAAVRAGDLVPVIEVQTHPRGDGFLARVEMDEAGEFTGFKLDVDAILATVKKTNRVVIVQEAIRRGGVASAIASLSRRKCSITVLMQKRCRPRLKKCGGGIWPVRSRRRFGCRWINVR